MKEQIESTDDKDVVIYDGHCKICTGGVSRLRWFDWLHRFRYVSLHEPEIAEKYPDLTYDMLMAEMYVVSRSGKRYGGAAGFRYMSWRIPAMWPVAPILNLPGTLWLWTWLYQLVAKNRYRFGRLQECEGGTCHVHFGGKPNATSQAK